MTLFDEAMAKAKAAKAPATPGADLDPVLAGVAVTAGALAQNYGPGTFSYHTLRPVAANVFMDAFRGLQTSDIRLDTSGTTVSASDSAATTVKFMQRQANQTWVAGVTVTLLQTNDVVQVTTGGQNMSAMTKSIADLGKTAFGVVGDMLRRKPEAALARVQANLGQVTGAAADTQLAGQVRSLIERLGATLDEEWQAGQRQKREEADRQLAATTCQYCGTTYVEAEQTCSNCHAPRQS